MSTESTQHQDGGPAFPATEWRYNSIAELAPYEHHNGMTLRDYFAGQALAGLIASKAHSLRFVPDDDARYCYRIADAMLAERERGHHG